MIEIKQDLIIRAAIPGEAEELTQLCRASKSFWVYPDEWMDIWKDDLTISKSYINSNTVNVLVKHDSIVGFYAVEEEDKLLDLGHFWIHPNFIGYGLGKVMMEHLLSRYDAKLLYITADPNAESFYQKFGFITFEFVDTQIPDRKLPRMRFISD